MKVVFMGTPDFAKESLQAIYEAKHEILAVVTNPDRPKGRGMKMVTSPVKEYAIKQGLDVLQPEKIKNNIEFIETIESLKPDVICVVAYGKILPQEILKIPTLGCINVHGSLLPQYRGAAPIQWAIINGDKKTGITTMYMDKGMDTGDMILTEEVKIGEDETTGELWEKLSKIGGSLLVKTLQEIGEKTAPRIPQGKDFTLAPMLDKKMSKIDWEEKTAQEIKNLVRGLNPIMGAYVMLEGKKIKFWKVDVLNKERFVKQFGKQEMVNKSPNGAILFASEKEGLYINAKNGIIKVLEIQGENSRKMSIEDFLRGNKLQEMQIFESN